MVIMYSQEEIAEVVATLRNKRNKCRCAAYSSSECGCDTRWPEDVAGDAADMIENLNGQRKRLLAVVDRLPLTADGVRVIPGDTVHRVELGPRGGLHYSTLTVGSDETAGNWWHDDDPNCMGPEWESVCPVYDTYSTRAAAEAAALKGGAE